MTQDELLAALRDPCPTPDRVPDRERIIQLTREMLALLYPAYYHTDLDSQEERLTVIRGVLCREIRAAAICSHSEAPDTDSLCETFLSRLPAVKALLDKDREALYLGDPAAKSREEVVLCYPGFFATSVYRLAHELYLLGVPLIPRIMTEYAHEKTGIDIHAGATIGEYFFIDHGTGTVIGETTVIGHHVKLYQGVTLGAKSFEVDGDGNPVKNIKRHPNIGSHVVIYANATILGGDTTVADRSVIGGNVWLTRSTEPGEIVYYTKD